MRLTIKRMIEEDLGYCCEYSFFYIYRKTAQIAARLGVTTRAVQKHRREMKAGCLTCQSRSNCLAPRLKEIRRK